MELILTFISDVLSTVIDSLIALIYLVLFVKISVIIISIRPMFLALAYRFSTDVFVKVIIVFMFSNYVVFLIRLTMYNVLLPLSKAKHKLTTYPFLAYFFITILFQHVCYVYRHAYAYDKFINGELVLFTALYIVSILIRVRRIRCTQLYYPYGNPQGYQAEDGTFHERNLTEKEIHQVEEEEKTMLKGPVNLFIESGSLARSNGYYSLLPKFIVPARRKLVNEVVIPYRKIAKLISEILRYNKYLQLKVLLYDKLVYRLTTYFRPVFRLLDTKIDVFLDYKYKKIDIKDQYKDKHQNPKG